MDRRYPHPIIAREGWAFVALALAVAVGLSVAGLWLPAALAWLAALFVVQFFRDPPRVVPQEPDAVLAPADGRIVSVGKARDPYLARDALKISVFMNVFNVHSNRSPVDGTVVDAWYHAGSFVNAALDKASRRERAQCAAPADRGRTRRDLRAGRRPDRAADPLLREARATRWRGASATASSASARVSTSTFRRSRRRESPSATRCTRPRRCWRQFPAG